MKLKYKITEFRDGQWKYWCSKKTLEAARAEAEQRVGVFYVEAIIITNKETGEEIRIK